MTSTPLGLVNSDIKTIFTADTKTVKNQLYVYSSTKHFFEAL